MDDLRPRTLTTRAALLAGAACAALAVVACQPTTVAPVGAPPAASPTTPAPGGNLGGAVGAASPTPAPSAPKPTTPAPTTAPPTVAPAPAATTAPPAAPPAGGTVAAVLNTDYPVPAGAVVVSPAGSDTAAGTLAAPLRTVAAALAKVPAGGTVVLRAGAYRESVASVTKRVTIQPYPHEQAWFDGTDVVTGWAADGRGWRSTSWRTPLCQTCYNPAAVDAGHPLAGKPDQVFVNGTELTQVAGDSALTAGTFYVDSDGALVVGSNPGGATVTASSRWRAIQLNDNAGGSVIRGIGFRGYAPVWNESQLGAVILNTTNVTFENNVVTDVAGTGLAVTRSGVRVSGNILSGNGYRGMVANRADGLVLSGNRIDDNNTAGFSISSCGSYCTVAGVKVAHTRGITANGNSFSGNVGAGFWCDLGCITASITGNTVVGNAGNGLFFEVSANGTITGNTIGGNGRGLKVSGSANVAVAGNAFTDNATDLGVYDDPRSPSTDPYSAQNGLTWNTANVTVLANTFADSGGKTGLVLETNATAQVNARGMIAGFAGNVLHLAGTDKVVWCASSCTTFASVAAFLAAVGFK